MFLEKIKSICTYIEVNDERVCVCSRLKPISMTLRNTPKTLHVRFGGCDMAKTNIILFKLNVPGMVINVFINRMFFCI